MTKYLLIPLLLLISFEIHNAAAQTDKDARPLRLGKPVVREISGEQAHSYQITLAAGRYLKATVEQRGIDVVVALTGPDGKLIFEFDHETRGQGQEVVSQVAEIAGSYRLSVQARRKEAPAGRYEIRLVELRAATGKDRELQEARKLNEELVKLYRARKFDEALPLGERVLQMREKALGPRHAEVAGTINTLASIHFLKGDPAKAEPLYQRALAIREKVLKPDHPDLAASLNNLANLYYTKQDYAKAEPLYQRALAISEKALGPEHPQVAATLYNLAVIYCEKGDCARAEPLFLRALAIREKALGPEHPEVAGSLMGLANVYRLRGDYAKAEPLYRRSLAIKEKVLGPEHPSTVSTLENLANLYFNTGDYAKAEPLYERALASREKALGPDHPQMAGSLNNFANLYFNQGDYLKAEPLYQRALAIAEKALGPDRPEVAGYLNNLAALYLAKGDFAKAEPLYERALAVSEKALGPEHPQVALSLDNLANFYSDRGDSTRAKPLQLRALAIREKSLGPDHPEVAASLSNLGNLHHDQGDYVKAEPLYQRALAITEKSLGPEHTQVGSSLLNLANLYRDQGDFAKAEPLYQRALAIKEKALGPEHPETAVVLHNLARLSQAKGDQVQAVAFQSRAVAISERNIALNTAAGSERQKLAYLAALASESDYAVSLNTSYPAARNLALTLILQRKGRALDAMTDSIAALRRNASPPDQALLDQLKEARSQLARLTLGGPRQTTPAEQQSSIKKLQEEVEKVEAEVSRRSDEFRAQSQPVTIQSVQAAIPADAALIEFFAYRPFNPKYTKYAEAYGQPRYVAYVLRRRGEVQWVELGEAKAIDEAIDKLRGALRDPKREDVRLLARAVDQLVMEPVRRFVGNTRRVFLSPDGALNLIPFAALVDEHDHFLIRHFEFSYLTSGRDLLRLQAPRAGKQTSMVIADPDFGEQSGKDQPGKRDLGLPQSAKTSAGSLAEVYFIPLPGTAVEAQALKTLLPGAVSLTKAQATEAALKQVSSPRVLHIATHGFFLEDLSAAPAESRGLGLPGGAAATPAAQRIENPMLRSGLALAGANLHQSGAGQSGQPSLEDGILTAAEVAALDLSGTKLVVLSACDTGVGEVKNGDGVYGLRRALVLAGSETQVMSLWPVSDQATRDLMIDYYRALQKGDGRTEALRRVQQRMLKGKDIDPDELKRILGTEGLKSEAAKGQKEKKDYSHPFYWASFIQSGEWANLDGKR